MAKGSGGKGGSGKGGSSKGGGSQNGNRNGSASNSGSKGGSKGSTSSGNKGSQGGSKSTGRGGPGPIGGGSSYGMSGSQFGNSIGKGSTSNKGGGNQGGGVASRVASINQALRSYSANPSTGINKTGLQGINTNMTEAQQRGVYSAGAAVARDHGVIANLVSRVGKGVATKQEQDQLSKISDAANRHSAATVVGGTALGTPGAYIGNGLASLFDGDDYHSQLGKRIGTGEMKGVLGSINDKFGQGGVADTAIGVAAKAASAALPGSGLVFNAISNGLKAPNSSAIAAINSALGRDVGTGDFNHTGSGKADIVSAPPRYSLPSSSDLDKTMAGEFNFSPSQFDVTPGIRAQYAWDGE